jgi:hypothetical protein
VNTQNPQEAFFAWLGESLSRAIDAVRGARTPVSPVSY